MTYELLKENRYMTLIPEEDEEKILKILEEVSGGEMNLFDSTLNEALFDTVMSRYVAADAFKQNLDFPPTGFIVVEARSKKFNKDIYVTVGMLQNNKNHRLSGVLYI